ncbi:MAG: sodium pump decarboxylase subunit gamma [Treponema sp.]|nr:sodium pump decarboxylase subunit gamma [Treponema sp.]
MSLTLMEMFEQAMVLNLAGMGALFIFMGVMINAIGSGRAAALRDGTEGIAAVAKPAETSAVTAAITAAVNEYRKNN